MRWRTAEVAVTAVLLVASLLSWASRPAAALGPQPVAGLAGLTSLAALLGLDNLRVGPTGVAVADVNGDGKSDLLVNNLLSNNISIFMGRGDGTFAAPVNYPAGLVPGDAEVGDFNRDGKLDLAVANLVSGDVTILLGNGDGTFRSSRSFPVNGLVPGCMRVADLTANDRLDLVTTNTGSAN